MFKYLFSLALVLFGACLTPNIQANTIPLEENTCNLPGPGNLHITGVGPTTLSFAWDAVAGVSGYDYELRVDANNNLVASGNTDDEFITFNGLTNQTVYRLTVWSVCQNFERGGSSTKKARTDYVIIGDLIPDYQGGNFPYNLNTYPTLFGNGVNTEVFLAQQLGENNEVLSVSYFNVVKDWTNLPTNNSDAYQIVLKADNEALPGNNNSGWLYGNENLDAPIAGINYPQVNASEINILQWDPSTSGGLDQIIRMNVKIFKNVQSGGTATLSWNAINDNPRYKIIWLSFYQQAGFSEIPKGLMQNKNNSPWAPRQQAADMAATGESTETETAVSQSAVAERGDAISINHQDLKPFPNPFSNEIHLNPMATESRQATVQITDINGKIIINQSITDASQAVTIQTGHLPNGVYLLRYEDAQLVKTVKLVKAN